MPVINVPVVIRVHNKNAVKYYDCGTDSIKTEKTILFNNELALIGVNGMEILNREAVGSSYVTTYTYYARIFYPGLTFALPNQLGQYIPENTRLNSVKLKLYVTRIGRRAGSTYTFRIGTESTRVTMKSGWISFDFTGDGVFANPELKSASIESTDSSFEPFASNTCRSLIYDRSNVTTRYVDYMDAPSYSTIINDNIFYFNEAGTYAPYLELTYQHNPPVAPDSLAPAGDTINPRAPIRFTWNSRINQTAFRLQYQVNGGTWSTVTVTSGDRYYDLPGNTITEATGVVNWRVQVAEYEGAYSDYVSSSFTLGTLPVKKPRAFAPVGDYVETTRPLTFEWAYDPNPGEEQAKWEIKHSINGGVTSTTLSGTTETSKTISIADWGSQEAVWQIRVANQFNEWSEWTEWMRFQTVGSPPMPQIISVTNNNQPIINWTASDQESFLIEILNMDGDLVYASGKQVNHTARQHKAKEIIKNGKYLIKLTVYNIYDVSSPTVEYTHIINSTPTEIPTITLFDGKYNVTVKSEGLTGMVYRNDVYIGDLIEGKFDDFTVESGRNYIYKIANVDGQGVYSESSGKNAKIDFDVDTIALLSNPKDFVFLHVDIDNDPTDNNSHVLDGVAIQVHGQSEPILEFGEFETTTKSVKYLVDDYRPLKRLIDSRQDIIFRHRKGENFIGAITSVTYDRTIWGYSVAFTMTKTAVVR